MGEFATAPQGPTPRSAGTAEWVLLVVAVRPRVLSRMRRGRTAGRLQRLALEGGTTAAAHPLVRDDLATILLVRADVTGALDRAQDLIADFGRAAPVHAIVCARRSHENVQRTVARAETAWRRAPTRLPGVRLVP